MKSYWKILLVVILAAFLFSGIIASAQENETKTYTLLQPLPGMEQTMPVKAILPAYLSVLFKFMLVLAGALAVLMIVFSGIMYITSGGNASTIEKAKSRIWSAVGGLVLAISAYLILYTINPDLVNLDLGIQPITITKKAPPLRGAVLPGETPLQPGDTMYKCKYIEEETGFVYTEIVRDCSRCSRNIDAGGLSSIPLKSCDPNVSIPSP